jgi:signal-transduction protein with cAMP-binding, CBS, and nucleotidyltransferase domain
VDIVSDDTVTVGASDGHPVRPLTVDDVMRSATSTVEETAHLAAAAYLMKHRGDTALVVTTDDPDRRPIALVTDADITQAVADGRAMEHARISDLGLAPPLTVKSGTSAREAVGLMLSRHIHHLPVVEDGRLVGVVEFSDACRPLFEAEAVPQPVAPDGPAQSRNPGM